MQVPEELVIPAQSKESASGGARTGEEEDTTSAATPADKESESIQDHDVSLRLELEMLQDRLHQRDREIGIVLHMLKQERKRTDRAEAALAAGGVTVRSVSPASPNRLSPVRLARMAIPSASSSSAIAATVRDGKALSQGVDVHVNKGAVDDGGGGGRKRRGLVDTKGSFQTRQGSPLPVPALHSSHDSDKWRSSLKEGESDIRKDLVCNLRCNVGQ